MSVNFKFCGNLRKAKDSDKFKSLDVKIFDSGWANKTLNLQGINGSNRHFFRVQAGYWANADGSVNESKTDIYTLQTVSEGSKPKSITVKYADRLNDTVVAECPIYRKFVIDLNKPGEEKDAAKRHEYTYEGDFLDALNKLLGKEDIENRKFRVDGTMDVHYDETKDVFYRNFVAQRVYLAQDDAEDMMTINGTFIFSNDSWDEDRYEETGKIDLNVWAKYYDRAYSKDDCKGNAACPIPIVFIPSGDKKDKIYTSYAQRLHRVPDGAEYGTVEIVADVIDGAQIEKITYDDLPDDVKEDIDLGLSDLETELKKAGGSAYGDRITEYRLKTARDAKSSEYDDGDVCPPIHTTVSAKPTKSDDKVNNASNDEDIFDI